MAQTQYSEDRTSCGHAFKIRGFFTFEPRETRLTTTRSGSTFLCFVPLTLPQFLWLARVTKCTFSECSKYKDKELKIYC